LEFFIVQRERDQLLREKMSVLHHLMIADRLVSLGLLAAGLSHHIRNALVAVKTFLDLAPVKMEEEKLDMHVVRNPDFWQEYHQSVQGQIERINNLLKDLWTASDNTPARFADVVALHEVVGAVWQTHAAAFAAKGILLDNRIPDSLPRLNVDGPKFARLFDLLLRDELASLPTGARVTLTAQSQAGGDKPAILVELSDNGPGLPQEALRVIFDPFVLRSDTPSEYGIHLMACFFIVHHHGGKIEARSENGRGTTFTIRLPTDPNTAPPAITDTDFLRKVLLSDTLWEKLVAAE
jgi:two-component system probable response regulator PhcQ